MSHPYQQLPDYSHPDTPSHPSHMDDTLRAGPWFVTSNTAPSDLRILTNLKTLSIAPGDVLAFNDPQADPEKYIYIFPPRSKTALLAFINADGSAHRSVRRAKIPNMSIADLKLVLHDGATGGVPLPKLVLWCWTAPRGVSRIMATLSPSRRRRESLREPRWVCEGEMGTYGPRRMVHEWLEESDDVDGRGRVYAIVVYPGRAPGWQGWEVGASTPAIGGIGATY